jgi:hypothetical protein
MLKTPTAFLVFALGLGLAQMTLADDEGALVASAKAAVTQTLRDPESTEFRSVVVRHRNCRSGTCIEDPAGPALVCGEYNAKNGYGGYAGYDRFIYSGGRLITEPLLSVVPEMWTRWCA